MMTRIGWVGLGCFVLMGCGTGTTPADICKGRLAGDLVITELMLDPEGSDTGSEWFEVYNTLGTDIDLKGMVIYTKDTDGSGSKTHTLKAGTIPAQGYFTFGDIRSGALPAWIGYTYNDGLGNFGNARGVIGIKCGTVTFDEVTWTRTAKSNRSRGLDPTQPKTSTANDDETLWCDTNPGVVYSGASAGTPGKANAACIPEAMVGTCLENGVARPIRPPGGGDLIITEIMANPKSASSATVGAWFEVLATRAVDLNDLTIATPTTDTSVKSMDCVPVVAGEYVLFARSGDSFINGSLPTPKLTYSLSITTGNNRLFLRRGDAGIDEAAFTTSTTSGISVQLDNRKLDVASNDVPENFCKSLIRFDGGTDAGATDFGSPGAPNEVCPEVDGGLPDGGMTDAGDPNFCFDTGTSAFRAVVRPLAGDFVITEFMANPAAAPDTVIGEWFEVLVKGTADFNGIQMTANSGLTSFNSANCLHYPTGSLLVFAKSTDPIANGNLGPITGTFTAPLANSNAKIVLYTDAGVVDQITWTTVAAGKSRQLDINKQDHLLNDLTTNFCDSDAGITLADGGPGDKGTPGLPNRICP